MEGTTTHPPIGTEIAGLEIQVASHDLSIVLWYPEDESSDGESFCAPVSTFIIHIGMHSCLCFGESMQAINYRQQITSKVLCLQALRSMSNEDFLDLRLGGLV